MHARQTRPEQDIAVAGPSSIFPGGGFFTSPVAPPPTPGRASPPTVVGSCPPALAGSNSSSLLDCFWSLIFGGLCSSSEASIPSPGGHRW
uniref:Uncharacterized protein n=1 Tax=Setaria viridis TaxID=4556 RepID=A0A4U6TY53_SETVI|nr:hypothetical protein SEVIR_8G260133v2 [Setaria viridis]